MAGPYYLRVYAIKMAQPYVCFELFPNKCGNVDKNSHVYKGHSGEINWGGIQAKQNQGGSYWSYFPER